MRVFAAIALLASCNYTVSWDFIDVTPARDIEALAGKSAADLHGLPCKSVCKTRQKFESINYCVVATLDVNPRLVCRLRRGGGTAPGYSFDVLVDVPADVDVASLHAAGPVPIELCEAANCRSKMAADDVPIIDACSIYPYRPDESELFFVCSYYYEGEATSM